MCPNKPESWVDVVEATTIDLASQRCENGKHENGLGNDHRRRAEKEVEKSQGAGPRQHEVSDKADHHRRKSHEGVEDDDQAGSAGKPHERQECSQRKADQPRQGGCRKTDDQGQPDDIEQGRIA